MAYYCVECNGWENGNGHISHKKWDAGVRFCREECKTEFFKKHYPKSIYREKTHTDIKE